MPFRDSSSAMEHIQKKVKITDHFRVSLKANDPHNLIHSKHPLAPGKRQLGSSKENVEVITLSDDEDDDNDGKRTKQATSGRKQHDVIKAVDNNRFSQALADNNRLKVPPLKDTINGYRTPPSIILNSKIIDHDRQLLQDVYCEPHYALESFNYDREQELKFRSKSYLVTQSDMTPQIRARLVDWLVEIQDTYSLYHETLYMAVKISDLYLMKKSLDKNRFQLLFMTAIFISAKFDERLPPIEITDLLQQTRHYTRKQIIDFEIEILKTLDFNIRFPLSYGFLRRFARCTGTDQRTLTLARYILESSLLDYEMIEILESEVAAASLLLAFKMRQLNDAWNETAVYYTRYNIEDLDQTLKKLNHFISQPVDKKVQTIRNKYSHKVYMSVSKIAPLPENLRVISTSGGDVTREGSARKFGKLIINLPNK